MKKILYILLLISSAATAQVKVGADGAIHPTGNYPATTLREARAYALSVQSIADRDGIPSNYRDTGMLILVRNDSSIYSLVGGITNGDWELVLSGGGGGGSGTVNNANQGTSLSGDTVQLGGSLYKNATITTSDFGLTLSSSSVGIPLQSSSAGNLAFAATTQTGAYAGSFYTNPVAANTVAPILRLYNTGTGVGANGIGGSLDFTLQATSGNVVSNRLISSLTTATALSETSNFSITGVNAGASSTLFSLGGSGALQLNKYGVGTFAASPQYMLGVDASGHVIETTTATANIILDSVTIVFDGFSDDTTFALTRPNTGFKNLEIAAAEGDAGGFAQSFNEEEAILEWQVAIKGSKKFYITYYY